MAPHASRTAAHSIAEPRAIPGCAAKLIAKHDHDHDHDYDHDHVLVLGKM
jgi:hypothetical protein